MFGNVLLIESLALGFALAMVVDVLFYAWQPFNILWPIRRFLLAGNKSKELQKLMVEFEPDENEEKLEVIYKGKVQYVLVCKLCFMLWVVVLCVALPIYLDYINYWNALFIGSAAMFTIQKV
jgi:hypothetical protein